MKIFVVIALMMATAGAAPDFDHGHMDPHIRQMEESRQDRAFPRASGSSRAQGQLQGQLEGEAADALQAIADRIGSIDVTALDDFIAKTAGVETDVPAAIDGLETALGDI